MRCKLMMMKNLSWWIVFELIMLNFVTHFFFDLVKGYQFYICSTVLKFIIIICLIMNYCNSLYTLKSHAMCVLNFNITKILARKYAYKFIQIKIQI